MRLLALSFLCAALAACGADSFTSSSDAGARDSATMGDGPIVMNDAGVDGPAPLDSGNLCGGLPCLGACAEGRICTILSKPGIRCLRVSSGDVFYVAKDIFGRVGKAGANALSKQDQGADYKECLLTSNGNSLYAVDTAAGIIYSYSTALVNNMIPPRAALVSNEANVRGVSSALPMIYWASYDNIRGCNLSMGCQKGTLVSNVPAPNVTVVDGSTLFFATTGPREIRRVPTGGGNTALILPISADARSMLVSGNELYFAAADVVIRVDLMSNTPTLLANGRNAPFSLVLDALAVYWLEGGAAAKVARNNPGNPSAVASLSSPTWMDADATHLYVAVQDGIVRIPK